MVIAVILLLFPLFTRCQTEQEQYDYHDLYIQMNKWGYTWESYKTVTADGWELTLFRVTGRLSNSSNKSSTLFEPSDKPPILF